MSTTKSTPSIAATALLSSASYGNADLFQKYYILATGAAATNPGIAWLETQVKANNDLGEVNKVIDAYMAGVEKTLGRPGALQMLIKNGLGVAVSANDAQSISAELTANKISSWSQIFNLAVGLKNVLGETLTAKASVATTFANQLDVAKKVDAYAGEAVVNAVKTLLQGTTATSSSIEAAKSGLIGLIEALSGAGIKAAVIDGYIAGASVLVDQNGDGKANPGEWTGTTDAKGYYVLPSNVSGSKVTASGGTDILTKKAFTSVLTAPAGSTVMNPITTLVQTVLETNPNALVSDAKTLVNTALGIPASVNVLSFDPLAVLASSSATAEQKTAALGVQATAVQVVNTMSQMASVIASSTGFQLTVAKRQPLLPKLSLQVFNKVQPVNLAKPSTSPNLTISRQF